MPSRLARLLPVALAALASACAHSRVVHMDEALVTVDEEELEISAFNAEELFTCGTAAYQAGNYRRSARCFTRLADLHPESDKWWPAQYNAGVAHEALEEWALAVERYRAVMEPSRGRGDALDAAWRAANCMYQMGDYAGAIAVMEPVAQREDLPSEDVIHATTHIGVCELERGDAGEAERRFRRALEIYRSRSQIERIEDYYPAQAQFFVGEIYRLHFEAVVLDQVEDKDKLGADLEYKAQLLLSAQGHYLRAIRMGNPHWGTAAGQRIGALYEQLYEHMMNAPVPAGFDDDETRMYRALLRRKVRVLVHKAISIYERTLATAERIGVESAFISETKRSLDRMKEVLLADAQRDEEDGVTDVPIGIQPSTASAPEEDDGAAGPRSDRTSGSSGAALARP